MTACADTLIKIPMAGQVESLNAAMASGILMYEGGETEEIGETNFPEKSAKSYKKYPVDNEM